jgi:hypothetical protein
MPDLADDIVAAAKSDPMMADALRDYEHVCKHMGELGERSDDRAQWAQIRAELVSELVRLLNQSPNI